MSGPWGFEHGHKNMKVVPLSADSGIVKSSSPAENNLNIEKAPDPIAASDEFASFQVPLWLAACPLDRCAVFHGVTLW